MNDCDEGTQPMLWFRDKEAKPALPALSAERHPNGPSLDARLVQSPHVVATAAGESWVLHDRWAERYYTLPGVAGRIWELLGDGRTECGPTIGAIVETIAREYELPADISPAQVECDVTEMFRKLLRIGVVRIAPVTGNRATLAPLRTAQPHW